MEQERLLIEAAQKDPRRFAELYETNFERVYAFIVRRVQDQTEAEDLTSEVFQHALANLSRFEWRGVPFAVWFAASPRCESWAVLLRFARQDGVDECRWQWLALS